MITIPIIATALNISISALTPIERWNAASNGISESDVSENVYVVVAFVTLIALSVLLVIVSLYRMRQQQTNSKHLVDKNSEKKKELNQSDDSQFVEYQRFLRVPVNYPAFVAPFPSSKELVIDSPISSTRQSSGKAFKDGWKPPVFVPAVVTELAGLGLSVDVPLDVKQGDRVLVMLRLDEEEQQDTAPPHRASKKAKLKILEVVGDVKHVETVGNGFSIAVELTGFIDSDVNELINAAKAASLKANGLAMDHKPMLVTSKAQKKIL